MPLSALRVSVILGVIIALLAALHVQVGYAATCGDSSVACWQSGSLTGNNLTLLTSSDIDPGTDASSGATYTQYGLYFAINGAYYPKGNATTNTPGPDVSVDVEYYDQGYSSFYMLYDGLGRPNNTDGCNGTCPNAWRTSFGFQDQNGSTGTGYITNNVVYLQNSLTWKTYRFNLTNVVFNGGINGQDFAFQMGNNGSATDPAVQGYKLKIRKVTVTKLASGQHVDAIGTFSGNYGDTNVGLANGGSNNDFGAPAWVWTRLGEVTEGGHGLYFDSSASTTNYVAGGSGSTTCVGLTSSCDKTAGRTGNSFFFNVNDNYIKNGKDLNGYAIPSVELVVEYAGTGSGTWKVQYHNAQGQTVSTAAISQNTGGSTTFKRYAFYINDAYFDNGLTGGNDFQIVTNDNATMTVRDVIVARTAGEGANRTGTVPSDWSLTKRLVGAFYFPVFDGFRPSLWADSTIVPANYGRAGDSYAVDSYTTGPSPCGVSGIDPSTGGTAARACDNNYVDTAYSYRSLTSNTKDLTDASNAGIDFLTFWFNGALGDLNTQGVVGVKQAVAAAKAMNDAHAADSSKPAAPRFAVMIDSVNLKGDDKARDTSAVVAGCTASGGVGCIDMSTSDNQGLHAKLAVDFYSLVPRSMWATIGDRPIVVVYYQTTDVAVGLSSDGTRKAVLDKVIAEFQAAHGVKPYVIVDRSWESTGNLYNLKDDVDDYFNWGGFGGFGGTNCDKTTNPGDCPPTHAGAAQPSAFEVSPGTAKLDGNVGVIRYRYNGQTYANGWDRAIDKGNHLVMIDTFNYFHEGSAISETKEFGRAYLDMTKTKSDAFKNKTSYAGASSVSVDYSNGGNAKSGIAADNYDLTQPTSLTSSGLKLTNLNAYFSIDDSFLWKNEAGSYYTVTITYQNAGAFFDFKYDSQSYNGTDDSLNAKAIRVCNANTAGDCVAVGSGTPGGVQTVSFQVADLYAGNRLINTVGADFLLGTGAAGTLTVQKIQITRPAAVPPLPQGWIRNFIPFGPRNKVF
ncbi:MAG TPA: DUF5010 domain-containing protein [Chloroflexota bacterium]|nr:DUF5010 domain-containing protein [Chloroflexota bacterium]